MKITKKILKVVVWGFWVLGMLVVILVLVLMPYIIDMLYDCPPPMEFFNVELSKSDILDYYAQFLLLLATIVLGVIEVIQNLSISMNSSMTKILRRIIRSITKKSIRI